MRGEWIVEGQRQPMPEPMPQLQLRPIPWFIPKGEATDLGPDQGWVEWDAYQDTEPAGLMP